MIKIKIISMKARRGAQWCVNAADAAPVSPYSPCIFHELFARSKRMAISMTIIVCLILVLCACSGGNQQSGTAPPSESGAQSTSSQPDNAPAEAASTTPTTSPSTSSSASSAVSSASSLSTSPSTSANVSSSVSSAAQSHEENGTPDMDVLNNTPGEVVITFDYTRQSGSASNQFAVWIEDMDGVYLQTVFATRWTANGGFNTRPDSIALWVEKSGIASMPSYYVDAVSGATPQTGEIVCVWDLTDINGDTVPPGKYMFFIEGTLRWKNYVLYSGVIEIGDAPVTVVADAEFVYAGSGNQAALTGDSPENAMIGAVMANYIPGD